MSFVFYDYIICDDIQPKISSQLEKQYKKKPKYKKKISFNERVQQYIYDPNYPPVASMNDYVDDPNNYIRGKYWYRNLDKMPDFMWNPVNSRIMDIDDINYNYS